MERLTFDGNFCDIAQCLEIRGGEQCPDGYCSQRRVWERLKEYEDRGMEPEHLRELALAEKGGRIVVLPCKVGSTLYDVSDGKISELKAIAIPFLISINGAHLSVTIQNYRGACLSLELSDFGKTVFLTREEAEAAMEAKKGGEGK